MADKPSQKAADKSARFIDRDVVQIEFVIDDLVKQLITDHQFSPVAACNGCKMCSSIVDLPEGRE